MCIQYNLSSYSSVRRGITDACNKNSGVRLWSEENVNLASKQCFRSEAKELINRSI